MDEILEALLFTFASIFFTIGTVVFIVAVYAIIAGFRSVQLNDDVPGAFDDSEQFLEEEANALEIMDDRSRQSYLMAKRWIDHNPPNSADTDISLSQYMTIQEKAVAAWEFTFDILQQPFVSVTNRTELEFRGTDDIGCVQTNLPLPKQKDVYYWETKIYDIAPDTKLTVGLTTKPYPVFRLPGMHRYSVAYDSTAHRRLNQPFSCPTYGRKWQRGDVIGVGYRTRSGTVFFTHNGKKLDDAVHGLRLNVFPTVGASGPANVYVNLGQDGFVFIQANVKEWGLAPAQGSLAPPPAYGDQHDSLLLESTGNPGPSQAHAQGSEPEAPPYVRRRSNDDAHASLHNHPASINTPPGSPPPMPLPLSRATSASTVDNTGSTETLQPPEGTGEEANEETYANTQYENDEDTNNMPSDSTASGSTASGSTASGGTPSGNSPVDSILGGDNVGGENSRSDNSLEGDASLVAKPADNPDTSSPPPSIPNRD